MTQVTKCSPLKHMTGHLPSLNDCAPWLTLFDPMLYDQVFVPERLGESQHKKEKNRLQFLTDKTYVKAFQPLLTTSDVPSVRLS